MTWHDTKSIWFCRPGSNAMSRWWARDPCESLVVNLPSQRRSGRRGQLRRYNVMVVSDVWPSKTTRFARKDTGCKKLSKFKLKNFAYILFDVVWSSLMIASLVIYTALLSRCTCGWLCKFLFSGMGWDHQSLNIGISFCIFCLYGSPKTLIQQKMLPITSVFASPRRPSVLRRRPRAMRRRNASGGNGPGVSMWTHIFPPLSRNNCCRDGMPSVRRMKMSMTQGSNHPQAWSWGKRIEHEGIRMIRVGGPFTVYLYFIHLYSNALLMITLFGVYHIG